MLLHLTLPEIAYINTLKVSTVILMLVLVDTLSAWIVVVNRFNKAQERECTLWNTFRGIFFRAWQEGYLESKQYRERLGKKVEGYSIGILVAFFCYILPEYSYNGVSVHTTIPMFIYLSIVLAEMFSIAENLKLLGIENIGILGNALRTILGRLGIKEDNDDNKDKK